MNLLTPISESERVQSEDVRPADVQSGQFRSVQIRSVQIQPDEGHFPCPTFHEDATCSDAAWSEVGREDLPLWNNLLLGSDATLYQYPFWNEPQRSLGLTPRYLVWENQEKLLAYVCILTVGFGPAKIGLVFRGPVLMPGQEELHQDAVAQLLDWARSQGYIFIRFTHSDSSILNQIGSAGDARNLDAFPYFLDYPILSPDYVVAQCESEADTLASFDREARRKIRRAIEVGYEFRCSDSPEGLAGLWNLFQECSRRKHFRLERPLSVYMEAMRMARPNGCARVFAVYLGGKPVGSALVLRDRDTAHCLLAAFVPMHRQSAVFLHWNCMRYMYSQGATRYNLGPGPGTLARFKRQFSPPGPECPPALTMVLKEGWFQFWMKAIFPVAKMLKPVLRGAVSRLTVTPRPPAKPASARWQTVGRHTVGASRA